VELSVVIPCLNEEESLEKCLDRALTSMAEAKIEGEVIVADNGSTDRSIEIAEVKGARVVHVSEMGYGSALMGGIDSARGKFIIMGDADGSYDFREIPNFVAKLREGFDLVQGCRLPSGGGMIMPGAMPFTHRWFGNPMFSMLARRMFQAPIHDIYCGLRGFTKTFYTTLDQRCTGMEFAVEMIIKSSIKRASIGEVPITLHPDDRISAVPHLRTFKDGWRTLRYFLMASPKWLFFMPGALLMAIGLLLFGIALPGLRIFGATIDAHTMLIGMLCLVSGFQATIFAVFAETYRMTEGLLPPTAYIHRVFKAFNLEKGLITSILGGAVGLTLIVIAVAEWYHAGFGRLDYSYTMRLVVPGVTSISLAIQLFFGSFVVSIMGMQRKTL
jgi:glycosyltransferase involved in cell wall biosynthesis